MLAAGCASRRPHRTDAGWWTDPGESLETYIRKVRVLSKEARPARPQPTTLEAKDPELQEALKTLAAGATTFAHRRVAEAYRQAGVLDAAYSHYASAIALDKSDAASYEGLARIWRDWGFPGLGMGDARRAIFYAPDSSAAYNTFGTLLHAIGLKEDAQRAFQRATRRWRNRALLR